MNKILRAEVERKITNMLGYAGMLRHMKNIGLGNIVGEIRKNRFYFVDEWGNTLLITTKTKAYKICSSLDDELEAVNQHIRRTLWQGILRDAEWQEDENAEWQEDENAEWQGYYDPNCSYDQFGLKIVE